MSIASEISRLQTAKADLATAIEDKGVTVPSATKLDGYADLVEQISGGGGEPDWDNWVHDETPIINKMTVGNVTPRKSAFSGCSADIIRYETAQTGNINGSRLFDSCLASIIVMPYWEKAFGSAASSPFGNCHRLKTVDMRPTSIIQGAFSGSSVFDTLIIRKTDDVCTLGNINAFNNTPFASGKTGGTLYVPSALVSSYQSATNWSTILGYENNQILPIEGSIYETQYADGTPIT